MRDIIFSVFFVVVYVQKWCAVIGPNLTVRRLARIILSVLLLAAIATPYSVYGEGDHAPFRGALELGDPSVRYNIVGSPYATQFFIPSGDMTLEEFAHGNGLIWQVEKVPIWNYPDYKISKRYWFAIDIINQSDEESWVLHISNFHIQRIRLLYSDGDTFVDHMSDLSQRLNNITLNPLGRGFPIKIQSGKKYRLVVELESNIDLRTPYFGLMTNYHYQKWSTHLRYAHILPLGVIFGLSFTGLICFFWFRKAVFFWFSTSSLLLLSFNALQSSTFYDVFSMPYTLYWWVGTQFSLLAISLYLFAFEFLQIKNDGSFLRKSFFYLISLVVLTYLISFFASARMMVYLMSANAVIFIAHISLVGVYKVRKEGGYYLIYMIGWIPIVFFLVDYLVLVVDRKSAQEEIEVSYAAIREVYYQVLHILIHGIAVIVQVTSLKRDKENAERTSLAKSWLMAANSHDLRQPLNTMALYISLLKIETDQEQRKLIVNNLSKAQEAMSGSFQSLMDLSQLEAGAVDLKMQAIEIQTLLQNIKSLFSEVAKEKGLGFKVVASKNIVWADPALLKRILSNLVSNAIKYTEQGRVLVICRKKGEKLMVQVWDTGSGIAEAEQEVIFDIYARANSSKHLNSGMGIGLAIVKKLGDLMQCQVGACSKSGKGSMFNVELALMRRD